VMFSDRHDLAKQSGPVALSEIAGLPLIALAPGAGVRELADRQSRLTRSLSRPDYEVSNISALHSLVARNVGIALVPALTARSATQAGITFRPLKRPAVFRELFFLRTNNRTLSPAAVALAERVLTEIQAIRQSREIRVKANLSIADLEAPAPARKFPSPNRA